MSRQWSGGSWLCRLFGHDPYEGGFWLVGPTGKRRPVEVCEDCGAWRPRDPDTNDETGD